RGGSWWRRLTLSERHHRAEGRAVCRAMRYDHHEKAGNQGDVVKHVALLAALDKVLGKHQRSDFRYADTFAGYAHSPIVQGGEWEHGIGVILGEQNAKRLDHNRHTSLWLRWYLSG